MNSRGQLVVLLALCCFVPGACSRQGEALTSSQRALIQARVTTHFDHTVLFKPTDAGSNTNVVFRLAPLIIQEVANTNAGSLWRDQFDAADSAPLVMSESGTTIVKGRSHEQISYFWSYVSSDPPAKSVRKSQGVRLTLNTAGEPVIWEVLEDSTGANILYVAQSLELAARAEFGPPLAGRKFSIERSLEDASHTVVANVIDDGPTPMGPVVYLRKGSRDVSTLICRCMEAQARELAGQKEYQLVIATNAPAHFPTREGIERRLRLPERF